MTGKQAAWLKARRDSLNMFPTENTWNTEDAAVMELRTIYKATCARKASLESQISELKKSLIRGSVRGNV